MRRRNPSTYRGVITQRALAATLAAAQARGLPVQSLPSADPQQVFELLAAAAAQVGQPPQVADEILNAAANATRRRDAITPPPSISPTATPALSAPVFQWPGQLDAVSNTPPIVGQAPVGALGVPVMLASNPRSPEGWRESYLPEYERWRRLTATWAPQQLERYLEDYRSRVRSPMHAAIFERLVSELPQFEQSVRESYGTVSTELSDASLDTLREQYRQAEANNDPVRRAAIARMVNDRLQKAWEEAEAARAAMPVPEPPPESHITQRGPQATQLELLAPTSTLDEQIAAAEQERDELRASGQHEEAAIVEGLIAANRRGLSRSKGLSVPSRSREETIEWHPISSEEVLAMARSAAASSSSPRTKRSRSRAPAAPPAVQEPPATLAPEPLPPPPLASPVALVAPSSEYPSDLFVYPEESAPPAPPPLPAIARPSAPAFGILPSKSKPSSKSKVAPAPLLELMRGYAPAPLVPVVRRPREQMSRATSEPNRPLAPAPLLEIEELPRGGLSDRDAENWRRVSRKGGATQLGFNPDVSWDDATYLYYNPFPLRGRRHTRSRKARARMRHNPLGVPLPVLLIGVLLLIGVWRNRATPPVEA